jgi:dTDP-4-amino-4,6-dideoxygalactose transaminase
VDKYTWVDIGSSYLPSEIVAAFLFAQLEAADVITATRREIFRRYEELFKPLEEKSLVRTPACPPECRHNAHMFYIILPTPELRDGLISHLKSMGIIAVFHYVPLHSSRMGRRVGYAMSDLPNTEDLSARLVRLPCFFGLSAPEQGTVVEEIDRYLRTG